MLAILDQKWLLFIKLAELGSLSRTSVMTEIPQSVLSRQLAQLELECGTRLFRRTGRGMVLSDFGEQLFPRLKAMATEAEVIADEISSSGGVPSGEVRIGLLPSTVPMLAARLYETAQQRFPKVRLHLTEGSSAQLEEQLLTGRIDMTLLTRESDDVRADETLLISHPLYLLGREGDPLLARGEVNFEQLAGIPLILPSPPHSMRTRLEHLARKHAIRLNMAIEADTMRLQHAIATAGGGYAIAAGGRATIPAGSMALIVDPVLKLNVVLSTTLRRPHTLATREVLRLMQQWVPAVLGEST